MTRGDKIRINKSLFPFQSSGRRRWPHPTDRSGSLIADFQNPHKRATFPFAEESGNSVLTWPDRRRARFRINKIAVRIASGTAPLTPVDFQN
jgi:hypothetical protein